MKYYFLLTFAFIGIGFMVGQEGLIGSYSFDGCSFADGSGLQSDVESNGDFFCDCGLQNESLVFNGTDNGLQLADTLIDVFYNNFTIDFYVNLSEILVPSALFSLQSSCSLDSSIYLRYLPQTKEIILEISEDAGDYYALKGEVNQWCWTRVTFSRDKLDYRLFIDNEEVALAQVDKEIPPGKLAKIKIGESPCVLVSDGRFRGKMDEFKIYDKSLTERDLVNTYLYPDQIITKDTTIFKGGYLDLRVGVSCFDDFIWNPTTSLVNPDVLDAAVNPEVTTTYKLKITDGICITEDEITVYVATEESQNCQNILLPKAFTPNGDRLNDTYGIANDFIVDAVNEFSIYDRWGGKVFTSKNLRDNWDGTKNGLEIQGGAYTYFINYSCKNKNYTKAGNFVLIK